MSTPAGVASRGIGAAEAEEVLRHYGLRLVSRAVSPGGGTANANAVVQTNGGGVFLKRRNPKYAVEAFVAFDHALMEHLAPRGVGTPLAMQTRDGRRWLRLGDAVYEAYPLAPGVPHDRHSVGQIAGAGRALAAYHGAVGDFAAPPGKEWPRYRDPAVIRQGLGGIAAELTARLGAADRAYLQQQVEGVGDALANDCYYALPRLVVHGDYHPGNVLFAGDEVVGIYDLDWATVQPRVLDLADGLMLFCGERDSDIDDADIVSLTQPWRPSFARGRAFMQAYLDAGLAAPLTPAEETALPGFVRALWLSCRVEGMAKVPVSERVDYLLHGLLQPLHDLDAMERLH